MNQYVTGAIIKELREKNHMTQAKLAEKLSVTDKSISKWETGKGYPDISLLESLAKELNVSITELIAGNAVSNANVSANMLRSKLCVSGLWKCNSQYGRSCNKLSRSTPYRMRAGTNR